MTPRLFAMDTSFYSRIGSYTFDARCAITAELGFDGTYLTYSLGETSRRDLAKLGDVKSRFGLDVAALWLAIDLANDAPVWASVHTARDVLQQVEGTQRIELCLRYRDPSVSVSDPSGDGRAVDVLHELLAIAARRDLHLILYPHSQDWLERFSDALRLCEQIGDDRLGCAFCGFHWYNRDETHLDVLRGQLQQAGPRLRSVNLNGSSKPGGTGSRPTIEPLDRGDLDNVALLSLLNEVGYDDWVGVQGYSVGGDVYNHLKRSRTALLDMLERVNCHPQWSRLQPDHI